MPQPSLQHRCCRKHFCNLLYHTGYILFQAIRYWEKKVHSLLGSCQLSCVYRIEVALLRKEASEQWPSVLVLCLAPCSLLGRSRGGLAWLKGKALLTHSGMRQMGPHKVPLDVDVTSALLAVWLGIQFSLWMIKSCCSGSYCIFLMSTQNRVWQVSGYAAHTEPHWPASFPPDLCTQVVSWLDGCTYSGGRRCITLCIGTRRSSIVMLQLPS